MKLENHVKKLMEHLNALEWALKENNQSSVGFHASQGSVELLSILLHKLNLVPMDLELKHNWFKSLTAINERLNFNFPKKERIIEIMNNIEELRNPLCYGSPKPEEIINEMSNYFYELKDIVEKETGESYD